MSARRRSSLISAAGRVIARAVTIQLEDAAAAAGPVAVRNAQAQAQAQAQTRSSSLSTEPLGFGEPLAASVSASSQTSGVQVSSEMYPAPSWRRRPTREPDYGRRQPRPAGAPTLPVADPNTPLSGAKLYGGDQGRYAKVAPEEDNDPHDLTAFSLSDPFDMARHALPVEDNDPHDLSGTGWSLSDPLDMAPRASYKPKPFKPVFIEGEDNDPHDLSAATRWSLADPLDLGVAGAHLRHLNEEDCDPHDLSAVTGWSLSDPMQLEEQKRNLKYLQSRLAEAEDNDPHGLDASTRWSLGDPTDHELLARQRPKKYTPPEFKPVFIGSGAPTADLHAATQWSMSDPLDFAAPRQSKISSRATSSATKLDEDNDPHDLMAATRWSFGDATDHEMLARTKKYQPPAFKPVFVDRSDVGARPDKGDGPHDLTAATKWSMSDPIDTTRAVKSISGSGKGKAVEDNDPHDLMASTRWSFGDPTDHEMLARKKRYQPPEFKPVFVDRGDVGMGPSTRPDKGDGPHDLTAATKWSMSDPLDLEPARELKDIKGKGKAKAVEAAEPATEPTNSLGLTMEADEDPLASLPKINRDPGEERVALRSSAVPTSRLGRLFHYGSLGLSLGLGAATESIRRTAGGGGTGSVFLSDSNVRRLVATLGRMRGAALKLGQFMSIQDNTMLPPEIERVLQQVQDHANYMPEWQMEKVLRAELGADWESLFTVFDRVPVAAASIGQVHRATLADGTPVAVKIQFPGVADSIESDLANASLLLRGSAVLPKGLYLQNTIAVAKRELEDECDYVREGASGARFHRLLANDPVFSVPRVFEHATTPRVLTTEWMSGRPLSKMKDMSQAQRDLIGTSVLRLCLQELFQFRFMQTDPNWANFLFDAPTGKIQLIDFGASREYTKEFMDGWYTLLKAALDGDRPAMKLESEKLGYLTGEEEDIMVNAHLDSMCALASPFQHEGKFEFATQTITDQVRALIPVMLQHRLTPPPAPTYSLNRKLSGAFLMCSKLGANVDCKQLWEDVTKDYKLGPEVEEATP